MLILFSLVSVAFARNELSADQLDSLVQTLLEKASYYEESLDQFADVIQDCADHAKSREQQDFCKIRLEKSYPKLKEQAPAQRAKINLNPEDIQLKKLETKKLEKRFWFSKSDGGSACGEYWKIWLDKWEVTIPKYGLKSEFWYFNPTKNPKRIFTSPECEFTKYFQQIIPLEKREWVHNNSVRIPLRNAITPDFYSTLYAEYQTPMLTSESETGAIAKAYKKVYADVYEVPDLEANAQKNFDLRIDEYFRLAEGVPQKRLERIVENLVAEKKMLVDGSVLKPYWPQAEWSKLSGDFSQSFWAQPQSPIHRCTSDRIYIWTPIALREKGGRIEKENCRNLIEKKWGKEPGNWTTHIIWNRKQPQKIWVYIRFARKGDFLVIE